MWYCRGKGNGPIFLVSPAKGRKLGKFFFVTLGREKKETFAGEEKELEGAGNWLLGSPDLVIMLRGEGEGIPLLILKRGEDGKEQAGKKKFFSFSFPFRQDVGGRRVEERKYFSFPPFFLCIHRSERKRGEGVRNEIW